MIKLVACDLDGTLLLHGSQELDAEIYTCIRQMKEQGILFVAASGRQYANLQRLFAPVKDDIAYICENGCLVIYQGEVLYKAELSWELGQEILHSIWKKDTAEILLSGENTSYLQPKKASYLVHMRDVVKNNITVVEDIFHTPEPYFKISVYEEDGIEKTEHDWKEQFQDKVTVVTSGNAWLDMMPKGVNKGMALAVLQQELAVTVKECMAFGDHYNDLEMLQAVEYGFAMDSGQEEIRRLCKYHTPSVEAILKKVIKGQEVRMDVRIQ
ncbi:MAG: HAD family hydrolase [Lachnospiraceae bacterium]|jgi:Cof subfamily protein (haloacid dehalogenase superfamily)